MNTTFFHKHHELFRTAKTQLAHVHNKHTKAKSKLSHDVERQAELCSMAIDTILNHTEDYDTVGYVPQQVQEHTVQMLESIPNPDAIFGLLEDLALITRGHTLFAHKAHSSEQALLQAFENAGEWQIDDGNIVSDWYWLRLPVLALMPDLMPNMKHGLVPS